MKPSEANTKPIIDISKDCKVTQKLKEHIVTERGGAGSFPHKVVVPRIQEELQILLHGETEPRFRPIIVPDDPDSSRTMDETATTSDISGLDILEEKSTVRTAPSMDKMNCTSSSRDEETLGMWIFPDDTRKICITASGKHAVHLMGCCSVETSTGDAKTTTTSMKERLEEVLSTT